MSRILAVVPLARALADEPTRAWLEAAGVAIPEFDAPSNRAPSPEELQGVIDTLPGIGVEYWRGADHPPRWYASALPDGDGIPPSSEFGKASIELAGDGREPPGSFGFRGGATQAHWRIVKAVSRTCGPQVYIDASGADPVVITPNTDLAAAL